MPDVIIKGYSGTELPFSDVPKVWLAAPESTAENPVLVPFTYGEAVEGVEITPDFASGDMTVTMQDGYLARSAVVKKPETLVPENIAKDVEVAGILGTHEGGTDELRYVTFMDDTGTVEYGKKAVAVGDDCADPIARGIFGTPTKESTAQYNYTFSGGWATTPNGGIDSNALKAVTEDRTVYANFISAVRYYTITFYDDDGTTVLKTQSLAYGSTLSYTPSKDGYMFGGWSPALATVTGDASYTASWTESVALENASWETIAARSADGTASSLWKVGDTKSITYTAPNGTTYTNKVEIIAFNHDETRDGTKAGITFLLDHSDFAIAMNTSSKTSGIVTGYYAGGWGKCDCKTKLNTDVLNSLDSELQAAIKEVKKQYVYNWKGTTDSDFQLSTSFSYNKLWLLSLGELGITYKNENVVAGGDGTPYPNLTKEKNNASGRKTTYALRSGIYQSNQATNVATYNSSGKYAYTGAGSASYSIIFGFCI